MSLGFGEAVTAIDIVIKTWRKIQGAQQEVDEMGEQLVITRQHVAQTEKLIPSERDKKLKGINLSLWQDTRDTTKKIAGVADEAQEILNNWLSVSHYLPGAQWEWKWVANFAALVKGNPDKLREKREKMIKYHKDLDSLITKLILSEVQNIGPSLGPGTPPRPAQKTVIFVDSYNSGRSVVAQSYLHLIREWTVRTKNHWPLQKFDSAGIRVSSRSAFTDQLKNLKPPVQLSVGNTPAFGPAINALFDQPYFNYQFKQPIRQNATKRKSRGLPADIFWSYDYILVFGSEQREVLETLRERYKATLNFAAKKDASKARIELLGNYGNHNAAEIPAPRDDDPERDNKWQSTVGNIKTCTKAFLMQQCGWKVPDKKDAHLQGPKLQDVKTAS